MSKTYNYDPNLFYERQLLDPYYSNNSEAKGTSRSYTHWTLYNTMPPPILDRHGNDTRERYDPNDLYPVISGIITDPTISVGIAHSFGAPSGIVGQIMNTVSSTASGVSETLQAGSAATSLVENAFGGFIDKAAASLTKEDGSSAYEEGSGIAGILGAVGNGLGNIADFGKSAVRKLRDTTVVTSMDYVKVYKGTTVQPTVPMLQTRLYHGIAMHSKYSVTDKTKFQVIEQLGILLDTFMGEITTTSDGSNTVEKKINSVLGLQNAPNHFRTEFFGLDNNIIAPGTFVLEYGDTIFKNLLVTGFNFTLSTINTPDSSLVSDGKARINGRNSYTGRARKGQYLYADVSIQVEPCKYWDRKAVKCLIRNKDTDKDKISFWKKD